MRTDRSILPTRISPRHSPQPPKSTPRDELGRPSVQAPTRPPPVPALKPEPDLELELTTSPPPVEQTLAARRAKRQAILAKYAGISSAALSQGVSPSPGPSSAVEPPPTSPAISNTASQSHSPRTTPALIDAIRSVSVSASGMISESLTCPTNPSHEFDCARQARVCVSVSDTRYILSGKGRQHGRAGERPDARRRTRADLCRRL